MSGSRSPIQWIYDRYDRLAEIREALVLNEKHLGAITACRVSPVKRSSRQQPAAAGWADGCAERFGNSIAFEFACNLARAVGAGATHGGRFH